MRRRAARDVGRAFLVIAAVLVTRAAAARASCAIDLTGDADTVARVAAALAAFSDDQAACLALRVTCDRDRGELVLELRDELGRAARRTFATADGAAAFLVSWSRRPLAFDGAGLAARGPDRSPERPIDPPADPLRGEFQLSYVQPLEAGRAATTATAGLAGHDGLVRYGGDVRVLGALIRGDDMVPAMWVAADVEASGGVEHTWRDRVRLRSELVAGARYATIVGVVSPPIASAMSGATLHAGARAATGLRLGAAFWLDAALSCEAVQIGTAYGTAPALGADLTNPFLHRWRLELGLQWAP